MKLTYASKYLLPSLVLSSLLSGAAARADQSFTVSADTSSLIGSGSAPFSLDFQFIDGSGLGDNNNSVTLSDFSFGAGGSWGGPATIKLTDSSFFAEFTQPFTPGNMLSFQVNLTTQVDAGGTPDEFSFAILNKNLAEIPTTDPSGALLKVDVDSALPTVQTFGSALGDLRLGKPGPGPGPAPTPDSSLPAALLAGVWGLTLVWHRRQKPVA